MNKSERDKFLHEKMVASIYLKSIGINPKDNLFENLETSTDLKYDNRFEFQITTPEGEPQKLFKHKFYTNREDKLIDPVVNSIIIPLERKINRYGGRGVSNVILLINLIIEHPLIKNMINERGNELRRIVKNSGFKSVFLITTLHGEIIKIG